MTEKERYTTVHGWVKTFQREGFQIDESVIRRRIDHAKLVGMTARDKMYRVFQYYAESDVRQLLRDYLGDVPLADDNNVIEIDGETFGTVSAVAGLLSISETLVRKRLKKNPIEAMKGRVSHVGICNFYSLNQMRSLFSYLDKSLSSVGSSGFINVDGEVFGLVTNIARKLRLSPTAVCGRIQKGVIRTLEVKDCHGRVSTCYALSGVRALCADILKDCPREDENGRLEIDGELYQTINGLVGLLPYSKNAIRLRIKKASLQPISAKDKGGRLRNFYSLSEVNQLFSACPIVECRRTNASNS